MTSGGERIAQLSAGINSSVTALTLKFDAPQIIEGAILGINLEELYVVAKSGTSVTVIRGFNGSTPASHATDDLVRINAKFTDFRLAKYVNETVEDISGDGLFRIKFSEFNFSPIDRAHELVVDDDFIDIWRVRYAVPGTKDWFDVSKRDWELNPDAGANFPSGKAITLQTGGFPSHPVRVSYKAGFDPLVNMADDILAVSGLHKEAHKILSYGAAINALGGREVKRTFLDRQPDTRRGEEVPPGATMNTMRPFLQLYTQTLKRERRRLRRMFPDQVW